MKKMLIMFVAFAGLLLTSACGSGGSHDLGISSDCESCAQEKCGTTYSACTSDGGCNNMIHAFCDCICKNGKTENQCYQESGTPYRNDNDTLRLAGHLDSCIKSACSSQCTDPHRRCGCQ